MSLDLIYRTLSIIYFLSILLAAMEMRRQRKCCVILSCAHGRSRLCVRKKFRGNSFKPSKLLFEVTRIFYFAYTFCRFPQNFQDLDQCALETLDAGEDLQADHPGFNDPDYRSRRNFLAQVAQKFRAGDSIPRINYTPAEVCLWPLKNFCGMSSVLRFIPPFAVRLAGRYLGCRL